MGDVQLFENADLGLKVRHVTQDGVDYFVLSDFAKALGYRDAANAKRVLRDSQYNTLSTSIASELGQQGGRLPVGVTEGGLYRLALRSDKSEAEAFQAWVEDEVLPSIRRDGGYVRPDATASQLEVLTAAITEMQNVLTPRATGVLATERASGGQPIGELRRLISETFDVPYIGVFDFLVEKGAMVRKNPKDKPARYIVPKNWDDLLIDTEYKNSAGYPLTPGTVRVRPGKQSEFIKRLTSK